MNRKELSEIITSVLQGYEAESIAVFGSFARDDADTESDIDILVKFKETKSLLDLVRIERELSETAGINVDLLTEKSISPYLIDSIKKEMQVLYPWKDMAGMRDKLIHDYFGIDIDAVWKTVEEDIPVIKKEIVDIIEALEK